MDILKQDCKAMKTFYDDSGWAIGDIDTDGLGGSYPVYHYGTDQWYYGCLTEQAAEQFLLDLEYDLK